ncbi:Ig-like domain-containing protein [Leifsonia poae]|uniref:Ig-like domain-containing protein n=1 Tax=Leifsonia poae TaxID=110933 RepID=UPI003D6648F8
MLAPAFATPAHADTTDSAHPSTPAAAPSETPSAPPTPAAPTIDDLGDRLARFPLAVSGRGDPGDHLEISGASGGTSCRATVDEDGTWGCSLSDLPDGPAVVVRAVSLDTGSAAPTRTIAVLSPPVIAAPAGGLVSGGGIRGTAYPGATVTVRASNGSGCSFPADSSGAWGCVLTPAASGQLTVTATQRGPSSFPPQSSAPSAAVPVTVDTTPPPAPTITTPGPTTVHSGDPLTFGGTGEAGSTVTVYASNDKGSSMVCSAIVQGASWSCVGSMPPGTYLVAALQKDAAGNVSSAGNVVSVKFTAPRPLPNANPSPSSPSQSPTTTPSPAVPVPPGGTPSPSPTGPGGGPQLPGMPGWMGTPFTTASAPNVTAEAFPGWLRSLILAAAALILLALPARLLAVTIARNRGERGDRRRAGIFGRNRSSAEIRAAEARFSPRVAAEAPTAATRSDGLSAGADAASITSPSRWSIAAAFAAAAALVTLSSPVDDAGAYVRVIIAIALGLLVVNAAWIGIARWVAPHLAGHRARIVFSPWLLAIVGGAAIASRIFSLQPALLFGLLLGVTLTGGAGRITRGRIAAVQVAAIAALGVLAWLTVGLLPSPSGVGSAFAVEFANAVSLLGLGSAAVSLVPIGALAGRAVFQWSRLAWIGLTLIVYTLLFALLLPVASLVETGQGTVVLVLAAVGFAALSVAVWLWERYVEPARE